MIHTKRVEQTLPSFPFVHGNLATRTGDVRVHVERLPEVVDALVSGARSDVQEDAYIGLSRRI